MISEGKVIGRTCKIKLSDKNSAQERLFKHLGMFREGEHPPVSSQEYRGIVCVGKWRENGATRSQKNIAKVNGLRRRLPYPRNVPRTVTPSPLGPGDETMIVPGNRTLQRARPARSIT